MTTKKIPTKRGRAKKTRVGGAKKAAKGTKDYAFEASLLLRANGFPESVTEHIFHVPREGEKRRLWRFDLVYLEEKIAIELHGIGDPRRCQLCKQVRAGRHHTIPGFREDRVKMNTAQVQGWIVIECTVPEHIKGGEIIDWTRQAFEIRKKEKEQIDNE